MGGPARSDDDGFEKINAALLERLPNDQLDRVFNQTEVDIDGSFLGFVDIYWHLSVIIPRHFTVVDLGCAYAPQAFFFEDHARYIGVDCGDHERFAAKNTTHYTMTIDAFLKKYGAEVDKEESFAICSYVPPWHGDNRRMVRELFSNLFVYYPHDRKGRQDLIARMAYAHRRPAPSPAGEGRATLPEGE